MMICEWKSGLGIAFLFAAATMAACSSGTIGPKTNKPPVADAGSDVTVDVGQKVTLDGSKSYDPDGDKLTYLWSFLTVPDGSAAVLSSDSAVTTDFTPDLKGIYLVGLVVSDGKLSSDQDVVQVTATIVCQTDTDCNDNNPCTVDTCQNQKCTYTPDDSAKCDDHNLCSTDDHCSQGGCLGTGSCDDHNPCTDDSCDPVNGCQHAANNANACDDGNACTTADHCSAGTCVGTKVSCDDKNPCTDDVCDPLTGCQHTNDNTNACNDGSACTTGDHCSAGTCVGTTVSCDDKNPCTDDSCDPVQGCLHTNNDANTCDDGNACTSNDHCSSGLCVSMATLCNDNDPCTDDSCDPASGCTYVKNTAPCNDGNFCTETDTCAGGLCLGTGDPCPGRKCDQAGQRCVDCLVDSNCNDNRSCTTDTCNQATGTCVNTPNSAACPDDGKYCNGDESCNPSAAGADPTTGCAHSGNPCLATNQVCNEATHQCVGCGADVDCTTTCKNCTDATCDLGTHTCNCTPNNNKCPSDGLFCNGTESCNPTAPGSDPDGCAHSGDPCAGGAVCSRTCNEAAKNCFDTNGTSCSDGVFCNGSDTCDGAGNCLSAGNPCVGLGACNQTCNEAARNCYDSLGAPCEDSVWCDGLDSCDGAGQCSGHTGDPCAGGLPCNQHCNEAGPNCFDPSSTLCNDGFTCTTSDHCSLGVCLGTAINCDDNNPCTDDSCNPADGSCVHGSNTNACSDGNPCTVNDSCQGGFCVGVQKNCDDGNLCTDDFCNISDGSCGHNNNGRACDDGNKCTVNDTCQGGSCVGTAKSCDDHNTCTDDSCDPSSGNCTNTNNADPCDDNDKCTVNDTCQGGICVGTPKDCDDKNLCTDDFCNSSDGSCSHNNNGNPCDDGNACTDSDHCSGGSCAGNPVTCNDGNPCTDDTCSPASGCVFTPNSSACNDGNACTVGDTCQGGACVGVPRNCDDGKICTDDTCNPASGCINTPNSNPCDDGSACTFNDQCVGGSCVGTSVNCDDNNPCTTDSCNPATGCVHVNNTLPCNDGNPCTGNDTCANGVCAGTLIDADGDGYQPPPCGNDCNDNNAAVHPGAKEGPMGDVTCSDGLDNDCDGFTDLNDVKCKTCTTNPQCDDGNKCNGTETCVGGNCVAGTPVNCDDGKPCTDDGCIPATGACTHTNNDSNPCSDNNLCTTGDHCSGGVCIGTLVTCDDSNVCTTDSCDQQTGNCVHSNNTLPCNDSNPCTLNDTCQGGSCVGTPKNCDDSNVCTDDFCNIGNGSCGHNNNGNACDDGDACTSGDHCSGGFCVSGAPINCDDGNACTTDTCNHSTGCVHTPLANGSDCGSTCNGLVWNPLTCQSGACTAGSSQNCDDAKVCTTDSCAPATGCVNTPVANGTDCGSSCSALVWTPKTCQSGTCTTGSIQNCNDGNVCTNDSCAALTGCGHTNNGGASCDDGLWCDGIDTCDVNGVCQHSGNPCATACKTVCVEAGHLCNNDPDHTRCQSGTGICCTGTCEVGWACCVAADCNDNNYCTNDTCPSGACSNTCNSPTCMQLSIGTPSGGSAAMNIQMCPGSRSISGFNCQSSRNQVGTDLVNENFDTSYGSFTASAGVSRTTQSQNPNTVGTRGVQICFNSANITSTNNINTTGLTNLVLEFAVANSTLTANNDMLAAMYSPNGGTTWKALILVGDNVTQPYQTYRFILPPEAENITNLRLQFRVIGGGGAGCGWVDDVRLWHLPTTSTTSTLLSADFESGYGPFTAIDPDGPPCNDTCINNDGTSHRLYLEDHKGANIYNTTLLDTTGAGPNDLLVLKWDWYLEGNMGNGHYVQAQFSPDGGTTWRLLSATGQGDAPTSIGNNTAYTAILPCDAKGIKNLQIRFIAPISAGNGDNDGMRIDNVYLQVRRPAWTDTFGSFTDLGSGFYSSTILSSTPGTATVTCTYGCDPEGPIIWSTSATVTF